MSKPWINEPSPITDDNFDHVANWHSEWACRRIDKKDEELVPARVCRDLERRFRHAERLLAAIETDQYGGIYVTHYGFEKWRERLLAHIEAAGRLDYE
jgi:hypothetical protein